MKVKLLRPARILHAAGEIVEVSPEQYEFLLAIGSAVRVKESPEVKRTTRTKK